MTFFPSTLAGWLGLLVEVAVIIGAVTGFAWRIIRTPLVTQINGLGDRTKVVEMRQERHDEQIRAQGLKLHDAERDSKSVHDRIGRIEGAVERLVSAIERNRAAHSEEEGEIRERLVRIETKVDGILHDRNGHH